MRELFYTPPSPRREVRVNINPAYAFAAPMTATAWIRPTYNLAPIAALGADGVGWGDAAAIRNPSPAGQQQPHVPQPQGTVSEGTGNVEERRSQRGRLLKQTEFFQNKNK